MSTSHDSDTGERDMSMGDIDQNGDKRSTTVQTTPLHFEKDGNEGENTSKERFWKFANKWWILETASWIVSLLALMGIIVLLGVFEQRPSPDTLIKPSHVTIRGHRFHYPGFLTINSLLSALATILKGTLLFTVAAALSQLKWIWFSAERPLSDFQMFDSASQGTFGSAVLLWSFKGRRLASLGAFLVLATLILDFSIQSLVSYPLQPKVAGQARIARTSNYNTFPNGIEETNIPQIDLGMLGAINAGIFDLSDSHGVSPVCSTGTCKYPSYKSLGVCSQCYDVTRNVKEVCEKNTIEASDPDAFNPYKKQLCTYSLPNQLNISEEGPGTAFVMSSSLGDSIHFPQLEESGLSIFSAMNATWVWNNIGDGSLYYEITAVSATECGLWFCERTYSGQVTNGTFSESTLDTTSDVPFVLSGNGVNVFDNQAIGTEFSELWAGNVTVENFFTPQLLVPDGPLSAYVWRLDFDDIKTMMASVATSMTTQMRNTGTVGQRLSPAIGTAWKEVPFVVVKWAWITLPATLIGLALVFLVATAVVSAKQCSRLWKRSSLAAFYHPLTSDGRHQLGAARDPEHVPKIAGDLKVKWTHTAKGWRFVKEGAASS